MVIDYSLAALGQNCDSYCEACGKTCVENCAFPGGSAEDLFSVLGLACTDTFPNESLDQPCYAPVMRLCYGITGIPNNINCAAGGNNKVRRLCPCKQVMDS